MIKGLVGLLDSITSSYSWRADLIHRCFTILPLGLQNLEVIVVSHFIRPLGQIDLPLPYIIYCIVISREESTDFSYSS